MKGSGLGEMGFVWFPKEKREPQGKRGQQDPTVALGAWG